MANRPTLNGKPVALKGDKTSTGGVILEGLDGHTVHGIPVAREGDKVWCPACKQTGTITPGAGMGGTKINGIPYAVHGSAVSCGCSNHTVIAPGQATKVELPTSAVTEPAAEPEQHAQSAKKPAQPDVTPITLVIGVFFDGTGNNAFNTRSRIENCTAEDVGLNDAEALSVEKQCRANDFGKAGDVGRSSYDSYFSNIHKLYTLYDVQNVNKNVVQIGVYVPGIGTRNNQADAKISMAIGLLSSGVVGNTDFALDLIKSSVTAYVNSEKNSSINIKEVKFDVFGFSRGAAAARHFSNRVLKKDRFLIDLLSASLSSLFDPLKINSLHISCRFIGLFDTVAAIGNLSDGFDPHDNFNGKVDLYLPIGIAEQVFQITAMHECRYNFSLNSVTPAYPEIAIPGVHSDIGGGYNPEENEFVFLNRPEFHTVPLAIDEKNTKAYQDAVKININLEQYQAIYPLTINNNVAIQSWSDQLVSKNDIGKKKRVGAAVTLKRTLSNELSNVALHIMLDAAQDAGAVFTGVESKVYAVPEALMPCLKKGLVLSKAARYGGPSEPFLQHDIESIAGDYIHCSANWNSVKLNDNGKVMGAVKAAKVISFVNRPCENWKRTVYDINGKLI